MENIGEKNVQVALPSSAPINSVQMLRDYVLEWQSIMQLSASLCGNNSNTNDFSWIKNNTALK